MLRLASVLIFFLFLAGCGVKGAPLPPETNPVPEPSPSPSAKVKNHE